MGIGLLPLKNNIDGRIVHSCNLLHRQNKTKKLRHDEIFIGANK